MKKFRYTKPTGKLICCWRSYKAGEVYEAESAQEEQYLLGNPDFEEVRDKECTRPQKTSEKRSKE